MKKSTAISIGRFREAYQRVGWIEKISKNDRYIVWQSPVNEKIWIELPNTEEAPDYSYFAQKNVLMLLYALDLPENQQSIDELISQLRVYNYKLINRIASNSEFKSDSIPYELASLLPQKNIEAFRHFYLTRKTSQRSIPIERFQFNHTEVGSFIIPISILVEDEKNSSLVPVPSETNHVIHQYLDSINTLLSIRPNNPVTYAEQVVGNNIDSKIVKDFLGRTSSIAKAKEKYTDQLNTISISSSGSPLLDYGLDKQNREFAIVNLVGSKPLEEDYVTEIEKLEVLSDTNRVEEKNAKIDVVVDYIDRTGKVRFTVIAINDTNLDKPFKASSEKLSKARLDLFAEYFKNDGGAVVRGDITKAKGRMGKVAIDVVGPELLDRNTQLL